MMPARSRGDPDLGDPYYRHWLAALERLAAEKGLVRGGELGARKAAWSGPSSTPPRASRWCLKRARRKVRRATLRPKCETGRTPWRARFR